MIELALVSSLIHPNLFGAAWVVLALACLMCLVGWRGVTGGPLKIWLIAFGPLLLIYGASAISNGLGIGRVEALELVLGGMLFAVGFHATARIASGADTGALHAMNSAISPAGNHTKVLRFLRIDRDNLRRGLVIALVCSLLVALYEMVIDGERRAGMVFQPINFGIGIGSALLMLVLLAQEKRALFFIGCLAGGVALLLTGSRGPILFFVVSLAIGLVLQRSKSKSPAFENKSQKLLWASLAIGFVVLGVVVSQQRLHVEAVTGEPSSHGIRWELIRLSLAQIVQTPWFGIGADQAGKFFSQFPPPIGYLNHAHITVLNLALELGIFGAAAWIWAFGALIWFFVGQRAVSPAGIWQAGIAITVFIFLCSMTQDIMSHSYTRKLMALAMMLMVVMCSSNKKSTS